MFLLLHQRFATKAAEAPGDAQSVPAMAILSRPEAGELEIRHRNRRVLLYAFKTDQFKPYVRELYTIEGASVLRDAPADHLHHHGLMYAIRVNGHNFWEETGEPGHERSVELTPGKASRSPEGLPQASFSHLIHWIAHKDRALADTAAVALLIERRAITVTVDEANQEVVLQWQSDFEVGRGAGGRAVLTGSNYNGLGMRLPQSFDRVAGFQNSDNLRYNPANQQTVLAAKWSAVSGVVEGGNIMAALFAQPETTRGATKFFTMLEPFAYLAVTQSLNEAPMEYSTGDKFSVKYLLAVYPSVKNPEFLQQRYAAWARAGKR